MYTHAAPRPRRPRLTHLHYQVLDLLRRHDRISYDSISAELAIDYRTAINAVRRLEATRRIVKIAGKGTTPNRYILTERLVIH